MLEQVASELEEERAEEHDEEEIEEGHSQERNDGAMEDISPHSESAEDQLQMQPPDSRLAGEFSQEMLDALDDPDADPELVMRALELGYTIGGTVEQVLEVQDERPERPQDSLLDPAVSTVPYDYYGDDIRYFCTPWGLESIDDMREIEALKQTMDSILGDTNVLLQQATDMGYWRTHKNWLSTSPGKPQEAPMCILARRVFLGNSAAKGCRLIVPGVVTIGDKATRGQVTFICPDPTCPAQEKMPFKCIKLQGWFQSKCCKEVVRIRTDGADFSDFAVFLARNCRSIRQLWCYNEAKKIFEAKESQNLHNKQKADLRALREGASAGRSQSLGGKGYPSISPSPRAGAKGGKVSRSPANSSGSKTNGKIASFFRPSDSPGTSKGASGSKSPGAGPRSTSKAAAKPKRAEPVADEDYDSEEELRQKIKTLRKRQDELKAKRLREEPDADQSDKASAATDVASKSSKKKKRKKKKEEE